MVEIFGGEEAGLGDRESAQVIVHPFPLEATVSYGSGTHHGPAAILRASHELELFDEEAWRPYFSSGDVHTVEPISFGDEPASAVRQIEEAVRRTVQADQFPLSLGGEHTVTLGCVTAVRERFHEAGVLFVDAHLDLRDEYQGTRLSHACVARRIVDDVGAPMSWCGTRSVCEEEAELLDDRNWAPVFAHEIPDDPDWIERTLDPLPADVYLSIDIDGLDPAFAPGTGTPEPGGLSYRQLIQLIRRLGLEHRIVGADIVEVAPIEGQQATEFTAAKIAAKLMGTLRWA